MYTVSAIALFAIAFLIFRIPGAWLSPHFGTFSMEPSNIRWTQDYEGRTFLTKDYVIVKDTYKMSHLFQIFTPCVMGVLYILIFIKKMLEISPNNPIPFIALISGAVFGFSASWLTIKYWESTKISNEFVNDYLTDASLQKFLTYETKKNATKDYNNNEYPVSGVMFAPREPAEPQTVHFLVEGSFAQPASN